MQQTWGWGALWSLGFGGLHLGPRWSRSEPVEGVEVPATSWQSQHGFRPLLRPSGDLRFDWGIAPSHVFLIMALQGPADHKAWQRGRCAPSETGLNVHQTIFCPGPRLSAWSPPSTPVAGCNHILKQTGWSTGNRCSAPTPAPAPMRASRARAHWRQGVAEGWQVGYCRPQTEAQTDGYTCSSLDLIL